jgi:ABC-type hemin transport system ATPase subunit
MTILKGQIVAIVGPVGSGKSSFLQGLIGEMRKETGSVKFAGSLSYCPQNVWIQVCPLAPRSIMLHLTDRNVERHHP